MNKTTNWIVGIIVVVAVIWFGFFNKSTEPVSTEPIKIGVILPLSGDLAFIGEGLKDAIDLAKESLKNTKYEYELIYEDDAFDPKKTANAVKKLVNIDKVNAIISFGSSSGNVISPVTESNKVVHFGIASDTNVAKGYYNFIHWTPPEEETRVFVEELQKREITKLGIFSMNHSGPSATLEALKKNLEGTNVDIVTEQIFNAGETDFRTLISKVENSESEIYLLIALSPELEILAQQLKEKRIETALTGIEVFELTERIDLFEGEWYVNAADPNDKFVENYQSVYEKNPGYGTGNVYDMFNLIVTATEKIRDNPTSEKIAGELFKIDNFNGALGKLSVPESGIVLSNAIVKIIKNGKPVEIK